MNKYYSYNQGDLPVGCQYCVKGAKLVLFVTGLCPRNCYFCPVSDDKIRKDIVCANERKTSDIKEVIQEAKDMDARGAGITGGDPLVKLDRTLGYIKALKEEFGLKFHIHLYTSLDLVNEKVLERLYEAGLDEIRFHLDLDDKKYWDRLSLARKYDWDVGVEMPLVPAKEKELFELVDFVKDKVDFLNLNELEIADNESSKLVEMGYHVEGDSYAVKDSVKLGLKIMEYVPEMQIHLCTAKLKDAVQLANRIKRMAKNVKKEFDIIDSEGMLTRGAFYLPDLAPGVGYRKKLLGVDKDKMISELRPYYNDLVELLDENRVYLDKEKVRILLSKSNVSKFKKRFSNLVAAVVTEYPTADQLEVEVEIL